MWAVPMVSNLAQSGKTLNHCDGLFLWFCSYFSIPSLKLQFDKLFVIYLKFVTEVTFLDWPKAWFIGFVHRELIQLKSNSDLVSLLNGDPNIVTEDQFLEGMDCLKSLIWTIKIILFLSKGNLCLPIVLMQPCWFHEINATDNNNKIVTVEKF